MFKKKDDTRGAVSLDEIEDEDEKSVLREVLGMVAYLPCVLLLTWCVVTFVGQRTLVKGDSMNETLHDKDNLIVDKISYRFKDPERYDIIVFPYQYQEETYYIKRIIGLPGETVYIDEVGTIYVNGEILPEAYGLEVIQSDKRGRAQEMIVLGADEYFVLGDNRNNSSDSRDESVGNVHRDDIIGRAWMRVWPISDFKILRK